MTAYFFTIPDKTPCRRYNTYMYFDMYNTSRVFFFTEQYINYISRRRPISAYIYVQQF